MEDNNSTTGKAPCKFFARGDCRKGVHCTFAHTLDNVDESPGDLFGDVQVTVDSDRLSTGNNTNDEPDNAARGWGGMPGWGNDRWAAPHSNNNYGRVPAQPHECMLESGGRTLFLVRADTNAQVATYFGTLMPRSAMPHPKNNFVFDWPKEHVANLFKETEFFDFIICEGIDGYALMEIMNRKDAFERLHADWSFSKVCRLYKAITELTREVENVVVVFLPLMAGEDGMSWFKAKSSVYERLSISYFGGGLLSSHVHELRGVRLMSATWNSERGHQLCLTFRSKSSFDAFNCGWGWHL
jgi:hypothetical protein